MNLRDKAFEKAEDFRDRALAYAHAAIETARGRAPLSPEARTRIETSLTALKLAGRSLRKVAGLHASKFVEQNSTLVRAAGKDVSALARSTYQQFTQGAAAPKPRKATATRKATVPRKATVTRKRAAHAGRATKVA
jgi:hypothetical protein